MAKQFFRDAVRRRLIAENPFDGMKGCMVKGNAAREFFISGEMAAAVLNACPDWQWRLIFALSRFGGMRCPSEHMGLRWIDVDLLGGKFKPTPAMLIHSPKTEHHEGHESRVVPIFPELRPYLEEAWEQAEEGEVYVIPGSPPAERQPYEPGNPPRTDHRRRVEAVAEAFPESSRHP